MLKGIPFDMQSIHDIHLKFKVSNIWQTLSDNPNLHKSEQSKDILFPVFTRDNARISISIHKTDTVTVIIGCTFNPVQLDTAGIINFFTLLTRIEEQFRNYLNINCISTNKEKVSIPNFQNWIITMWHFGRDSLIEYAGKKYSITVQEAKGILVRIYSKEMKNGKMKHRIESQECPQTKLVQAIQTKINSG